VRVRDALFGAAVLAAVYLPFSIGVNPFASMNFLVDKIRFNDPLFALLEWVTKRRVATAAAVVIGLAVAAVCRGRLTRDDPAAWAWPMAASLAAAPVIYPWYLLSLTPFLLLPATLAPLAWTLAIPAVYVVWELFRHGAPWVVPTSVLVFEYGVVLFLLFSSSWILSRRFKVD
jgi:hypothetical protein